MKPLEVRVGTNQYMGSQTHGIEVMSIRRCMGREGNNSATMILATSGVKTSKGHEENKEGKLLQGLM